MELTKNADKFICYTYKHYLEKLHQNESMFQARQIAFEESRSFNAFQKFSDSDLKEIICEAARAGYGDMTMECNFFINDALIVHMENRFKNGLKDVIDFITNFI